MNLTDLNFPILNFPYLHLFRDIGFGLLGLILILFFHGLCIIRVSMRFERRSQANLKQNQYNRVFLHFYIAFILIALIHMSEIFIWTMLIQRFNLIADPIDTIIFVGSCYTTVGFASDILPQGWKSVAFFISFSGLFTLAWTTAMMIGMIACYKEAWTRKYAASS